MAKQASSRAPAHPVTSAVLNWHMDRGTGYPKRDADYERDQYGFPKPPDYRRWIAKGVRLSEDAVIKWFSGASAPPPRHLSRLLEALCLNANAADVVSQHAVWEIQMAVNSPDLEPGRYNRQQDSVRCQLLDRYPNLVRPFVPPPYGDAEAQASPTEAGQSSVAARTVLPAYEELAARAARLLGRPACQGIRNALQSDLGLPEPAAAAGKVRALIESLLATQADKQEERALFAVLRIMNAGLASPALPADRHDWERALTQIFVLCLLDWMLGASPDVETVKTTIVRVRERDPLAAAILAEAALGGELCFDRATGPLRPLHYVNTSELGIHPGHQTDELIRDLGAHVRNARRRWSPAMGQASDTPKDTAADVRVLLRIERGVKFRDWRLLVANGPEQGQDCFELAASTSRLLEIPLVVIHDELAHRSESDAGLLRPAAGRPDQYVHEFLSSLERLTEG